MTTMAALQALSSVLVLLLLTQHAPTARGSTLEDTCRVVGTGGAQDYDFCVKTLGADPAGAMADELGLAVIALRMARATAKATGDRIAQLRAAETSPRRRLGLDECAKDYAWTVSRLGRAAKNFATGGGDEDEATALLEVRGTPARCDQMFVRWAGESSPLTDADRELDSVIELAFNILWHAVNNGAK